MKKAPSIKIISNYSSPLILPQFDSDGTTSGEFLGFNRLDLWSDYTVQKRKWVLSAYLGWDLHTRINSLADIIAGWGGGDPGEPGEPGDPTLPPDWIDLIEDRLLPTGRSWFDLMETQLALWNAINELEGFEDPIQPITILTMLIIVGSEATQFRFVNNKVNPSVVDFNLTYNNITKKVLSDAVILQHMTYGIKELSPSKDISQYRFWDIALYESGMLDDEKVYYLEAKCNKEGSAGNFILSEKAHKMEEGDGYLYFLVGVLNSVRNGARSFAPLYGFTEILPGRITVDMISSADGKTYFDLARGKIVGDIEISNSGTSSLDGQKYSAVLSIMANLIASKVESQQFDILTGNVSLLSSMIDQQAGSIQSTVTRVDNIQSSVTDTILDETTYTQWSSDGVEWHDPPAMEGDMYYRLKKGYYTQTWGAPIKAHGLDGATINMLPAVNTYQDLIYNHSDPNINNINDARLANDSGILYVWDGFKWANAGVIKGPPGRTAMIYRAYADELFDPLNPEKDIGFSTKPFGKSYMGTQITFAEVPSNKASDYQWALIKGEPGRSIVKILKQYFLHDTNDLNSPPPEDGANWSIFYPTFNPDFFLWIRDKIFYNTLVDGKDYNYSDPVYVADWEAINDIRVEAEEATDKINVANQNIDAFIEEFQAFTGDYILDAAEISSLEVYINTINSDKNSSYQEYLDVKDHKFLKRPEDIALRTLLTNAWTEYDNIVDSITNNITNLITDIQNSEDENVLLPPDIRGQVRVWYNNYASIYANLKKVILSSVIYIQNEIEGKSDRNQDLLELRIETNESDIQQLPDLIKSIVKRDITDGLGTRLSSAESTITQTANEITHFVREENLSSAIIQSPTQISALALKVVLSGTNQIDLIVSDNTRVKNSMLKTDNLTTAQLNNLQTRISLTDDSITLTAKTANFITNHTNFRSKVVSIIVDEHIDITAGDLNIKASDIDFSGASLTATFDEINITAEHINLNGYNKSTGFGIDKNGYLTASNATIQGNITALTGRIGGFFISQNVLTNQSPQGTYLTDANIVFTNTTKNTYASMGGNVLPTSSGITALARFENNQSHSGLNAALLVGAANGNRFMNHAIDMMSGVITGLSIKVKQITGNTTLNHSDVYIACYNTTNINIYTPYSPEVGKIYIILRVNSSGISLLGSGGINIHWGTGLGSSKSVSGGIGDTHVLIFDGQFWHYNYWGRS